MSNGLAARIDSFLLTEKWNIGYVNQSAESLVVNRGFTKPIKWLNEDESDCSADPFVYYTEKELLIIYEEVKRFNDKGKLCVVRNMDFQTKQKVVGLHPNNIHYSYPYMLREGDTTYCVPESSAAEEVCLYELSNEEGTAFRKVKTLLHGKQFVDTSLIKYKGMYWLFTICKKMPSQLMIYYSSRIDGEYEQHRSSPVTVDPYTSRGAGNIFYVNNVLFRPTQNHIKDYGGSVIVNRINELTEHTFHQESLFEIEPQQPYTDGLHHLSVGDDVIVIDGKVKRCNLGNMWRKLKRKVLEFIMFLPIIEV